MKVYGIIPARYNSSRFPGKVLAEIKGKSMIRRVHEQASKSDLLEEVIIATDDDRIKTHVEGFGGRVVMTDSTHQSGTERCAEVAGQLKNADIIVNIQCDEPFIDPAQIDQLIQLLLSEPSIGIATLAQEIKSLDALNNPNIVKVVFSVIHQALYFSRQTIPFQRDKAVEEWLKTDITYYKHIGLYAYRVDTLERIAQLKPSSLELAECLEQLRWLQRGFSIAVAATTYESYGIDTPEDLENIDKWLDSRKL